MAGSQSPKLVATINFKGGVGKTTITWCLADSPALFSNQRVLGRCTGDMSGNVSQATPVILCSTSQTYMT